MTAPVPGSGAAAPRTLVELLAAIAARGARPFLGGREPRSAQAFAADADALARGLVAAGVRPGDRVAFWQEKGRCDALAPFAAARAGAIAVIVNPAARDEQFRHVLDDADARLAVVTPSRRSAVLDARQAFGERRLADPQELSSAASDAVVLPPAPRADDLAILLYTSGSTGRAKGVAQTHRSLADGARIVSGYLGLTADDHLLGALPSSFDYGLNQLLGAGFVGARITPHAFFTASVLLRAVVDAGITVLAGVPELWVPVVDALETGRVDTAELRALRIATNSGGRLPARVARTFLERLPWLRFFSMYGLTEAFRSSFVPPEQLAARLDTVGRAMPEVELLVVDPASGRPVAPGEVGELVHCGACVAAGYWNRPDATAERFRPDPRGGGGTCVFSGDLATIDTDGWVTLLGRADAQLKVAGQRVSPDEVTEVVRAVDGVVTAAAVGVRRGADGLPALAVAVVAAPGAADGLATRVVAACRARLPSWMVPAEVHVVDALPLNANHKLDHTALRARLQDAGPPSMAHPAPDDPD